MTEASEKGGPTTLGPRLQHQFNQEVLTLIHSQLSSLPLNQLYVKNTNQMLPQFKIEQSSLMECKQVHLRGTVLRYFSLLE